MYLLAFLLKCEFCYFMLPENEFLLVLSVKLSFVLPQIAIAYKFSHVENIGFIQFHHIHVCQSDVSHCLHVLGSIRFEISAPDEAPAFVLRLKIKNHCLMKTKVSNWGILCILRAFVLPEWQF